MNQAQTKPSKFERVNFAALTPARVRVDMSEPTGTAKVDAAEALSDAARTTLARIKIEVPGGGVIEASEAFSIGYAYHETGFELTVAPKVPAFRQALASESQDMIDLCIKDGAAPSFFTRLVFKASKRFTPEFYAHAYDYFLDRLTLNFAQQSLGYVMVALQAEVGPTLFLPKDAPTSSRAPAP